MPSHVTDDQPDELSPAFRRELQAYGEIARALEALPPARRARAVLLAALSVTPRALDDSTLAGLIEAARQPTGDDERVRQDALDRVRQLAASGELDDAAAARVLAAIDGRHTTYALPRRATVVCLRCGLVQPKADNDNAQCGGCKYPIG